MFLEIIKWTTVIFALLWPMIYGIFWKPNITNKSKDYFSVKHVERNSLTVGRYITIFWTLEVFWICAEDYNTSEFLPYFISAVILSIPAWIPVIVCQCKKRYYCLPVRKGFDMREAIASIENEQFFQIREDIWHSKSWIRISNRFFPRSAVSEIKCYRYGGRRSSTQVDIITTDGKTYKPYQCSYYDQRIHKDIEKIKNQIFENKIYGE